MNHLQTTLCVLGVAAWLYAIRRLFASSSSSRRWVQALCTWALVSGFYAFQFFLRSTLNPMSQVLMKDFSINVQDISYLSAAYYIPYVWLQIPLGGMLDRWGPKLVLRGGTIICVCGALIFAQSTSFAWAFVGRFLIGVGGAASLIGSIRMNSLWLSASSLAFATGLLSGLGKIGGSAANGWLPLLLAHSSWHHVLWAIAWAGALLCVTIWVGACNGPEDQWSYEPKNAGSVKTILSHRRPWFLGLYGCALYATLTVFSDTYSIPFMVQKMNISLTTAGQSAALVGLGSALGSALVTGLSDWLKRRLVFVRGCAVGTCVMAGLVIWYPMTSLGMMNLALLALGLFSGGQILALTLVCDTTPRGRLGLSTGIMNAFLMSGGMIINPIIGKLLHYQWAGQWHHGAPVYDVLHYQKALSVLLVLFVAACVISWGIPETHPKNSRSCPLV